MLEKKTYFVERQQTASPDPVRKTFSRLLHPAILEVVQLGDHMNRNKFLLAWAIGASVALLSTSVLADNFAGPQTGRDVLHDTIPSLRDLKPVPNQAGRFIVPLRQTPYRLARGQGSADHRLQEYNLPRAVPTIDLLNFPGVGYGDYGDSDTAIPPDTNGAVGTTQYVQFVNDSFAVFDKLTGALVLGPISSSTLWSGFKDCGPGGDITAQFDKIANRWILAEIGNESAADPVNRETLNPAPYCMAVSQTSDATGAYYRYEFKFGNFFPDYPKIAVWPDAYYFTANLYGKHKILGTACAFDRASMLTGASAAQQCFENAPFDALPSDLDGTQLPPAGSPNYLASAGNAISISRFHVDWQNPANTTLSAPVGVPNSDFTDCFGPRDMVPQPGTDQLLEALAFNVLYRAAYRNFGDHETLVLSGSACGPSNGRVGERWYEIRDLAASPAVFQAGTFAPGKTLFRWMGSAAMDKVGDIALGYSASSTKSYPSIRYTGRVPSDPLGKLEKEKVIKKGGGSEVGDGSEEDRWGDYSSMSVDPVDDCTFWYTNEYQKTTGYGNWSTEIASFKFPSCH